MRERRAATRRSNRDRPDMATSETEVLSTESAKLMAAQLQESWAGRWQVMWQPWSRLFRAFPAYDMNVSTPVEGRTLRELWRNVLNADPVLLHAAAHAIPAHPPRPCRCLFPPTSSSPLMGAQRPSMLRKGHVDERHLLRRLQHGEAEGAHLGGVGYRRRDHPV